MKKDWQDAIDNGDADRVRSLLDAGADVNALDRYGQTALMNAAHKGYKEIVWLLAKSGADLNHTAKHGLSALMLAVISNHSDVVSVLMEAGADSSLRGYPNTYFSKTALELADSMGHARCSEILRSKRN